MGKGRDHDNGRERLSPRRKLLPGCTSLLYLSLYYFFLRVVTQRLKIKISIFYIWNCNNIGTTNNCCNSYNRPKYSKKHANQEEIYVREAIYQGDNFFEIKKDGKRYFSCEKNICIDIAV